MTPDEAIAYYDDPAHAQSMCDLLMRTRPGWSVWRGVDKIWRARRDDWEPEMRPISDAGAGRLNLTMHYMDERGVS